MHICLHLIPIYIFVIHIYIPKHNCNTKIQSAYGNIPAHYSRRFRALFAVRTYIFIHTAYNLCLCLYTLYTLGQLHIENLQNYKVVKLNEK